MNANNTFRLFSCVDEAAGRLHSSGCENIRISLMSDHGHVTWGPWVEISAAVAKILGNLSEDQLLIVEGQRLGKVCRPRPPVQGIVVVPRADVAEGKYTGANSALKGLQIDDESKLIMDEIDETFEPSAPPVQAPPPAAPSAESPDTLRAAAETAAAQTKRPGRPKGSANKSSAPASEEAAAPVLTRPISQIQAELDGNRGTLEKLHHANVNAIAAVVQGNQQIESALKVEAALLGELEAAFRLQREQAEKARAALAALSQ